ncbi:MAG TPA: hypothetical protein VHB54_02620 [Mucilaginibacter sp.]|nr:hypothetical protein [Mucilaginibacter sp.]
MIVSLTIVRYRKALTPFALLAMIVHHIPMWLRKKCSFYKLLGTGKGEFSTKPNWQQWGTLAVWDTRESFDDFYAMSFIRKWWNAFGAEQWTILCEPIQCHGKWSGKAPFTAQAIPGYNGPVVVLTRARIRLSRLLPFWRSVKAVAAQLEEAPGRVLNFAIGQTHHLIGTFSVWDNADNMKAFAYSAGAHLDVINRVREESWFTEDLFARFRPVDSFGTLDGTDPVKSLLAGKDDF